MPSLSISDQICVDFPLFVVAAVTASDVRGDEPWPQTEAALDDLERRHAAGRWSPAGEDDPEVAAWHTAYRSFGTNPRRIRPSVDALGRRLVRGGSVPRISSAVDTYNLVSLGAGFPAGALDLDRVVGDVEVRRARVGDAFTPLGEPDVCEAPKAGEVVYADGQSVLTRHWNHRDSDRTKVTESSTRVVFLLETITGEVDRLRGASDRLAALLSGHCERAEVHVLDAGTRTLDLPPA